LKHAIADCWRTSLPRVALRWLLTLGCALCGLTAAAAEPLHFTTADLLNIAGRGYSPPPYSMDANALPGTWQAVDLPHAVTPQRVEAALEDRTGGPRTVVSWYRLRVPPLAPSTQPRYLYIPRWKADGQLAVYGDNRLLYQSHASMEWNSWNLPLWIALDETADAVAPRVILLRMEHPVHAGAGLSSIWLGEESSLHWRYRLRDLLQAQLLVMSSGAFLAVGLFALFVWLRQRDQPLYLLFFGVSATSYLRGMHFYVGSERLPIPDAWFSWVTVNSMFWLVTLMHFFLNHLHRRPVRWLNRAVLATTLAMGLATLPIFTALPSLYVLSSFAYLVLLVVGLTTAAVGLHKALGSRSREGAMLAGWGLLGMLFGVYDWLMQNNYVGIEGLYLGPYATVLAFLVFTYIMFRRYVDAVNDVKKANTTLEDRLQAREAELMLSHQRLREVEQRQTLAQERQRLMQDMHDGLGSSLASALRVVEKGRLGEADVAQVLKGCIDDLKLAIDSMEPVESDLLLLLATLRFRLEPRLESTGITLHWEVNRVPPLEWLDPKNALHILRILQEAFTNIIKHTQATEIRLSTAVEGEWVVVRIADNGQGFSVAQALQGGGKGLSNQQRRAQAIGAAVDWASGATGTCFSLRLPIPQAGQSMK